LIYWPFVIALGSWLFFEIAKTHATALAHAFLAPALETGPGITSRNLPL
jgi:hypothetical protein